MDTLGVNQSQEKLRQQVEEAQSLLQRAASAAFIQGDPLTAQLHAISIALGVLAKVQVATENSQAKILQALNAQTGTITKEAAANARASALTVAKEFGPQLLSAALPTMRSALRMISVRSTVAAAGALITVVLLVGAFTYAAGVNVGRGQGELAGHAIQAAMAAGPDAAVSWSSLMTDNDPILAMAACRKSISTDADGRHYCFMPVWLDPPSSAPSQQP